MFDAQETLLTQAARVIASDGVIAFRTDTFYGLGAHPFNITALQKLRKLKGREDGKPILLLISDASEVDRFIASKSEIFDRVAAEFWPGPLTIVVAARPELPIELTAGSGTIGLRLPDDDRVRGIVRACGGALTATSANPTNQPPARTAIEVKKYFKDEDILIIDDGEVTVAAPSTVIDLSEGTPRIIREGLIPSEQLGSLLN